MKAGFLTFVIILQAFFAFSQPSQLKNCDTPMPDHIFRQKQRSVSMQATDDLKLSTAMTAISGNCLSVEQVRALAELFMDDRNRLEFAKIAWHSTIDKANFYAVYDAFAYFSTVFMLYDYVKSVEGRPMDRIPPYEPPISLNFPAFDYPSYTNYQGPSNCNYPIREGEFTRLANQVNLNKQDASRLQQLQQIAANNCLSVTQAMKFASLLESENNRLEFFKVAINTIFDIGNLSHGTQLFLHFSNKSAYDQLIATSATVVVPEEPICYVPDDEFTQILASIRKESFNSTKVTLSKQILRSKQCFSTSQVREMLKLFSFDDSRLEMAKFAYDFTIDSENYYQVADVFTFTSSREELMKYLSER